MKRVFKKPGIVIGIFLVTVSLLLLSLFWYNSREVANWLNNPRPRGQLISIGSHKLYTTVKGEGSPTVILLPGMNAFSWGWWGIQDEISRTTMVITYDRAGYGWSEAAPEQYSSKQIVTELHTLLQRLQIDPPYILVGASMGGIYAM
ncbi:MAG: alpha/beta hydrolase, partial [Chlorobium sp.]|nr:alpha/beta hydrolase [Chlorobium sp.]